MQHIVESSDAAPDEENMAAVDVQNAPKEDGSYQEKKVAYAPKAKAGELLFRKDSDYDIAAYLFGLSNAMLYARIHLRNKKPLPYQ